MQSKMGKILGLLFIMCMLASLLSLPALAAESGYCGMNGSNNVKWALNDEGLLTLSGKGQMDWYYGDDKTPPWSAFSNQVKAVQIDEGITNLCFMAFRGCYNLKSVDVPASIEKMSSYPFAYSGIESINVSEKSKTYTSIDGVMFTKDGTGIVAYPPAREGAYVIPEGVTVISDEGTFSHNTVIAGITLPSTMTVVRRAAFMGCSNLKSVTIPEGVKEIGLASFRDCTSLESIVIPEGIETIEESMFADCQSLNSVTIPASVKNIKSAAFFRIYVKDIYYTGTKEQWEQINIEDHNDGLSNPTIHYSAEPPHNGPSKDFADLDMDAWYIDAIDYALANGLMNGVGEGKFDPNGTTTRAMIVTMLYRLEASPAVSAENPFTDVADGAWYTDPIIWAASNSIVDGYGDGIFGPTNEITREQLAVILYRYAKYKEYDVSAAADLSGYDDAGKIGSWALDAMKWANAAGLVNGRTATTLAPEGKATRAETAAIFMRFGKNAN